MSKLHETLWVSVRVCARVRVLIHKHMGARASSRVHASYNSIFPRHPFAIELRGAIYQGAAGGCVIY